MKFAKLNQIVAIFGLVLFSFSIQPVEAASEPNDANSLQGLGNTKVVFDITQGNPKKLLGRLKLIEKTAEMMAAQGVKPDFVLAFRGPASFYASSDRQLIPLETHDVADQIAAQIRKMDTNKGMIDMYQPSSSKGIVASREATAGVKEEKQQSLSVELSCLPD